MKKNLLMLLCAVSLANVSAATVDISPPDAPAKQWLGKRWLDHSMDAGRKEIARHSFGANAQKYSDIGTKSRFSRPFRVWGHDAADYGRGVKNELTGRWGNWFKTGDEENPQFSRSAFVPGVAATVGRAGLAGGFGYGLYKNAYQNALLKLLRLAKAKEESRMMNFARGRGGKYLSNLGALMAYLGLDAATAYAGDQRSLVGMGMDGVRSFDRGISSSWYDAPAAAESSNELDGAAADIRVDE